MGATGFSHNVGPTEIVQMKLKIGTHTVSIMKLLSSHIVFYKLTMTAGVNRIQTLLNILQAIWTTYSSGSQPFQCHGLLTICLKAMDPLNETS